jgi:hypothetical protein
LPGAYVGFGMSLCEASQNLKETCKSSDGLHESRKEFMKADQGLLNSPKENPQIPERIWSILEVMRGLKNGSREIHQQTHKQRQNEGGRLVVV